MKSGGTPAPRPRDTLLGIIEVDLDINVGLNRDGGDLLDHLRRRVEVDDALVDAHLEPVPGVGALTARRLAHRHAEGPGRHADRALHLKVLLLGALDQVRADLNDISSRNLS